MAQPNLESFEKRALLLKQETTEGTDASPTALANGILLIDGSSSVEADEVERNIDRAFFTHDPVVTGNHRAIIEGRIELFPPATPGQASTSSIANEVALLAAGMAVVKSSGAKTTRYNPVSTSIPSTTAYWHHNDYHLVVLGARHDLSSVGITIGDRMGANLRVMGSYNIVQETALPSATLYSSVPTVARHSNTVAYIDPDGSGGGSEVLVWAKSLIVDFGNEMASKEYSSKQVNAISDRRATFTMRIARTDLSDINPFELWKANTIITARMRTFNAADPGLYSEIGIRGQITGVSNVDIDGDHGVEITGRCIASDSGGDEFYLLFGDNTV